MRKRGEIVERSFAHALDRGGMRRTWLRGRQNVHKRCLVHVAGYNLGILTRALFGGGTPKEAAAIRNAVGYRFIVIKVEDKTTRREWAFATSKAGDPKAPYQSS